MNDLQLNKTSQAFCGKNANGKDAGEALKVTPHNGNGRHGATGCWDSIGATICLVAGSFQRCGASLAGGHPPAG